MLLDVLIPVSFSGYGAAMLLRLGQGEDSLPHSRLQGGATPLLAWRIIAVSLIASAGCDVLIAYNLAMGQNAMLHWVPSLVSSLSLLSLGALGLSHAIESQRDDPADDGTPSQADLDRDQAIIANLDDYVRSQRPFVDPDLTLARLARKLVVPAKQLSAAINRIKGENVSRYINRQRIEDACRRLLEGQSVTSAMLDSGFNTKSNFNREFLRVKGASPSKWLQDQRSLLKGPQEPPKSVILQITESRFE
jgi:AraC-like DNA-binding protein